ncbi:solute carrier family 41 member 1-like [Centruroides sculpturatus]|uniref:solute carrier family 41 member 1-like n=1 Tax=Centruroides sculpturatus TaxID=218467 RepID=UPI000C6E5B5E|nr:solute carrier family 41 member 1-like [Centruroides sculpturatus]
MEIKGTNADNPPQKFETEMKHLIDEGIEENGGVSENTESLRSIFSQVFFPFLIAGLGTVAAGLILDIIQYWSVFKNLPEMFILVPSLLGLKGNLEMTLASRLSTQANLGNLDQTKEQYQIAKGNLALVQCQATVVGFLASLFAILVDYIEEGTFSINHAFLICASSLLTASIASFLLGCVTIGVVIISRKCLINPDNVAAPVAASLGDVVTLTLLSVCSQSLYSLDDNIKQWIQIPIIVILISLVPLWWLIAYKNEYTRIILYTGWVPVITAVVIASAGGYILDTTVSQYKEIAVFQPVINGVGGNLVAVQASRISTSLHQRTKLGILPTGDTKRCIDPFSAFFGKNPHVRTANLLLFMVIPGQYFFLMIIHVLKYDSPDVPPLFYVLYPVAALIQVAILLYSAYCMILWMWKWSIDPDNSSIPYLTALGDLLGTALLAIVFYVLYSSKNYTPA